ncbi:MAG: tetratricopeptide repeat protein [Planctomycetes bacterium]|nr:tetratricopeptide repeat protein [Planctomycetota bacterium]
MANPEEQPDIQEQDAESDVSTEEGASSSSLWNRVSAYVYALNISKLKLGISASVVLLLSISVYLYVTRDQGPTPREQMEQALNLLGVRGNADAQQQARVIAKHLIELDYRNPRFAGAPEYILGITTYRSAKTKYGMQRDRMFSLAAQYLFRAESRTLGSEYRPEWAFALGSSLYGTGQVTKSRKLLEQAVETFEYGRVEATFRLIDMYFDIKTPDLLKKSLDLNTQLLNRNDLTPVQNESAYLNRAQILMALDRKDEARQTYEEFDRQFGKSSGNLGISVLRAQTLMDDDRYEEALELLRPVAEERRLEQTFPRQASYLQGVCEKKLGKVDAAIFYFERTVKRFEDSHEGLAANVSLADLLHQEGRSEEAFLAYQGALRLVQRTEDYRNQWLSIDDLRKLILGARNNWIDKADFENAIALSKIMTPLFPRVQALELTAGAHQKWAAHLEQKFLDLPFSERQKQQEVLREQWRNSGRSHSDLAFALRTTSRYPEVLWISAEHFQKGHDFQNALNQITRFINTRPRYRLPMAYLRRGKLLLNLGQLDEALEHFMRVVKNYPTDASAYNAQLWIGRCYLEKNEIALAEKAWRNILKSEILTPDAQEWREAQFELGRLLFQKAFFLKNSVENPRNTEKPETKQQKMLQAFANWDEAISLMEEYLNREENIQTNLRTAEARFLLARSLQMSAELPRRKLKNAQTEIARNELHRTMQELLLQARDEFRTLQTDLLSQKDGERLDELGSRLLREAYFQIAHTYYDLENYEEAIIAFSSAVHRNQEDPQVLLAYFQMANCNVKLNKPDEARSMIEQAKVILNRLPDDVFQQDQVNMTKNEWKLWLDRWGQFHPNILGNNLSATP